MASGCRQIASKRLAQSRARVGRDALSAPGNEPIRTNQRGAGLRKTIGLAEVPVWIAQIVPYTKNIEGHVPEFPRHYPSSATPILRAAGSGEQHEVADKIMWRDTFLRARDPDMRRTVFPARC